MSDSSRGGVAADATEHGREPADAARSGLGAVPSRTLLIAAVTVAALVRIAWTARHGFVMEQEGVEYARIAENLRAGRGYVGIFANGTQLNFPPLYPVMIAAVSFVTGSFELAARVINVALGALLVIPMFRIADLLYGRRVAAVVAVLAVFHPVLIAGGASTYAEGPYLTLFLSGLACVMAWALDRRVGRVLWAGVFFGLAYLVRPEAFVMVGALVGAGLAAAVLARERRAWIVGALALAGTFAVIAAPNVIFLTRSTGKLRIEAKGTLAYQWGQRINAGMPYEQAVSGIGEDLSDQGVFMRPNLEVVNSPAPTPREYLAFLMTAARRNVSTLRETIVDEPAFGSPFLFVLAVLGLLRSPWTRRRVLLDGTLVATTLLNLLVLSTVQALWFRYFYLLLAILLIWGAKGADELYEWGRASVAAVANLPRFAQRVGSLLKWGILAVVLALSLRAMPEVAQYRESLFRERAEAGRWLATQSPPHKWIMDVGLQVPYYAGGDLVYLPYATSELALKYIAKRKPDFIVLHSDRMNHQPYTAQWFAEGVPDKRAVLVYDRPSSLDEIRIYRWVDAQH